MGRRTKCAAGTSPSTTSALRPRCLSTDSDTFPERVTLAPHRSSTFTSAGAVGAGAREGDMCRRELEASKPSEGFGREGVGGADGGKPRVTRRAGDAGGSARRVPGPESRPSPARTRSSGSARGPARVARDARSALDLALNRHRREPRARLKKSQFEMSVAKKTVSGVPGPLPEPDRARFSKPLFRLQNTHPSLLPRTPRACRARPLNYHGNRRDDRSTRREIARHVARRVTRVKYRSREKKHSLPFKRRRRRRRRSTRAFDATPPSGITTRSRSEARVSRNARCDLGGSKREPKRGQS